MKIIIIDCVSIICRLSNSVCVYNSLKSTRVCKHLLEQISLLLDADLDAIKINVVDLQLQEGATDCGLYAIATGNNPLSRDLPN